MKHWISLLAALLVFLGGAFFFFGSLIRWWGEAPEKGNIAVLKIDGGIFDPEPTLQQIAKLKKMDSAKAVVVRIDSPGGSVSASQEIFEAFKDLKEKKRIVVSMGTVAASGGYYVALPADRILANPGTITGSIGVRLSLLNAEELVKWARLKPETLKSGAFKDIGSAFRPMTDDERNLLQEILIQMHEQFKQAIVDSRRIPKEEVDKIADGRVITGAQAVDLKLIDGLGTLQDAVKLAGQLAEVQEPVPFYPPKEGERWIDRLLEGMSHVALSTILELQWRPFYL